MPQLLIIDDDWRQAEWLRNNLEADGYQTHIVRAEEAASTDFRTISPDLIVVCDVTWVTRVRDATDAPLIFLTSLSTPQREILRAFAKGADDCIAKPASVPMIRSRIHALLRRTQPRDRSGPSWVRFGTIELHPSRLLRGAHRTARLTAMEYALLHALVRHRGRVVPRDELIRSVWNRASTVRTVDTHINSLRRKLEAAGSVEGAALIFTVHGAGYGFAVDPTQ